MGIEIERRFLVAGDHWRTGVVGTRRIRQGYLAREAGTSVRVRVADGVALLTIKGPGDIVRQEYEYAIAAMEAEEMLSTICAGRRVTKTRHEVPHDGLVWEVDVFEGHLAGLVLAEVELDEAGRALHPPPWVGAEVTHDGRFANAALASAEGPPRG